MRLGSTIHALFKGFGPDTQYDETPETWEFHTDKGVFQARCYTGGYVASCWVEHLNNVANLFGSPVLKIEEKEYILEITTAKGSTQIEFRVNDPYAYGGGMSFDDRIRKLSNLEPITEDF